MKKQTQFPRRIQETESRIQDKTGEQGIGLRGYELFEKTKPICGAMGVKVGNAFGFATAARDLARFGLMVWRVASGR